MQRLMVTMLVGLGTIIVPAANASAAVVVRAPKAATSVSKATGGSTNWAGYVDAGTSFTSVRGSWVQPAVKCSSPAPQLAAFWVGLDGYTSPSVEQIGTDSDCPGLDRPVYSAWYEVYPAASVLLPARYAVHAGDKISAQVTGTGRTFTLVLADATAGWRFSTSQASPTAQNSSAEWVAEAPSVCSRFWCRIASLANFGSVKFTSATATASSQTGTISAFPHHKIVMVTNSGAPMVRPSVLANKGQSFTAAWVHS